MNKLLATVVILLVPLQLIGQPGDLPAVKKPDPLPAAARVAMERYDKQVAEAKKTFDVKATEAADVARKELARLQEQETRAGRLDAALAIKAEIERLPEKAEPVSIPPYLEIAKRLKDGTYTAEEWNKLVAPKVSVPATHEQTPTDYVLRKGDIYVVVPCPTDEWTGNVSFGKPTGYQGNGGYLRLRVMVGDLFMKGFVAEGEGKLILSPFDQDYGDNSGAVRVKIIKIR
jgi:hypothetical protein